MNDVYFSCDKAFSDKFMLEIRAILGTVFFKNAPIQDDYLHNTDIFLDSKGHSQLQISVRTRRYSYLERFGDQFTLCFERGQGGIPEYQKIIGETPDGKKWGTHILYSFESENGKHIEKWFIGDFDVFRKYVPYIEYDYSRGVILMNNRYIGDINQVPRKDRNTGMTYFDRMYAYNRDAFPGFVIAKSDDYANLHFTD